MGSENEMWESKSHRFTYLNIWSLTGGTVCGCYRTFKRKSLARGSPLLEEEFENLYLKSNFQVALKYMISASCSSMPHHHDRLIQNKHSCISCWEVRYFITGTEKLTH